MWDSDESINTDNLKITIKGDIFYEEQKREKIKAAQEEVIKAKKKIAEEEAKRKQEEGEGDLDDYPIDPEPSSEDFEPEPELDSNDSPPHKVSDDIKQSLESDDPWIQRKIEENK